MSRSALLLCFAAVAAAQTPFAFRETGSGSLELAENGKPVYVYNYGPQLKPGAPEDRRRCCYIHPLYAPDGTALTADFPGDHLHHRGVFWAWPIVRVGGQTYDLWSLRGIRQQFVRWIERKTEAKTARLALENGWYTGRRRVAKELIEIVAARAGAHSRELRLTYSLEALDAPIELAGEPAEQKGYGGFNVRFAPREKTTISTARGRETADSNMSRHPWAQLAAVFDGRPAGVRIDIDPGNTGFPNGWCLRHYGFLGVNFPGLTSHTIQPARPLILKYSIVLLNPSPGK